MLAVIVLQGRAPAPPLHRSTPTRPLLRRIHGRASGTITSSEPSSGRGIRSATGTFQQSGGAAAPAAGSNDVLLASAPEPEAPAAALAGEAPAAATILCPLPAGKVVHSSRVGHTAVHSQQGHDDLSLAPERQVPCRQGTGSNTSAAAALDGGRSAAPAKPVLKRRRVQNAFKAPRAVIGQENKAAIPRACTNDATSPGESALEGL
jgi:hypothetical protein